MAGVVSPKTVLDGKGHDAGKKPCGSCRGPSSTLNDCAPIRSGALVQSRLALRYIPDETCDIGPGQLIGPLLPEKRDYMTLNSASVSGERACLLRPSSFAKDEPFVRGIEVTAAKLLNRLRCSCLVPLPNGVATGCPFSKQLTRATASLFWGQDAMQADRHAPRLSTPTPNLVLDEVALAPRREDPQPKAG
jgi:hypothetical protein